MTTTLAILLTLLLLPVLLLLWATETTPQRAKRLRSYGWTQRRIAEQRLSGIVGRDVSEVRDLDRIAPRNPEPADMDWWLETTVKSQPQLIQARETLTQTGEQLSAARAAHLPTIQASGGYSVSKGSTFLPEVETRQWYVGFSVSVPLYSGGDTVARTRRAGTPPWRTRSSVFNVMRSACE